MAFVNQNIRIKFPIPQTLSYQSSSPDSFESDLPPSYLISRPGIPNFEFIGTSNWDLSSSWFVDGIPVSLVSEQSILRPRSMEETRQQSLIEMSRQLEEMRAHQAQQTEAEEQRYRAQELRSQAMQENISRMVEMMQTLMPRPVTYPSSSNHGNTTTPTLPQHPPRPPDPVVAGTGSNTATEQPLAHRAPLNPHGLTTRLARFEFSKFDGTSLREWIYRCEQFFMLDSTPPESKVRLASLHMEGKVLQWHHTYMSTRYDQFPSWPEYIVAVTTRFGELFDDSLAELVSSKQNAESVEDEVQTEEQCSTVEACDANLHKGGLKCDELIHRDEEPSQILAQNEPNSAKESSVLVAHQVLEEMPRPFVSDELMFLDEIEKINDELLEEMDSEAPPIGSIDELDGMKVIEDGELRNTTPTIHALKLNFSEQTRMMNGIVNAICFDPGGTDLTYGDLAISLPNGNYEGDVGEEKELIQVEGSEPVAVKEISDFIAHHVLDNMPSRETELMTELSRDNDTLNQQKLVVRVPAVPESKWDKKLNAIELLKVVDISTNGGLVTSLPNGAEKTTNELVTAEHELEVATAQEKIGMGCIETLCFDPGGSLLPVDTSIRTKLTEISILVGNSSFPLRDDLCLDWIAYRKAEKFEFICTHLLENGDQKEMKNLVLSSLTNLQKSELHSNYSMSRGALVFLYAFCFDPGGGIYVSAMNTVMETDEIWLGSSSVLLENVDFIQHYMSEIDVSLYWNADGKSEKVKGMLKEEDYEVCLILFYSTNGQTFDPRGQVLRNLTEPLLKTFHFDGSFMLEFEVIKEFPCPLLYYLDVVQISKGGCCKVMPFDPGGDELVVLLVGVQGTPLGNWSTHANLLSPATSIKMAEHLVGAFSLKFVEEGIAYVYDSPSLKVIRFSYKMSFSVTHLIQEMISVRVVTVAAAHGHHEGKVLILVFDPGGKHVQLSLVAMLIFESYILEDKDLLNKGELLQEYGC